MPAQWPVAVNFWADPGDAQATTFLQSLAPYMLRLGAHVRFQTIYNVFSLEGGSEELCLSQGLYEKYPRLYCSFEPNAQVLGLTGSEVVQESLLQSCLYDTTKVIPPDMKEGEFSREWWLYQQRLGDPNNGCSFNGNGKNAWGPACSQRVLSEVLSGGQKHSVDLCMADESGRRLLEFSKNNRGWSIVAMTINGARYSGQLAPEPVLRAICSATVNPMTNKYRAEECNDIVVDAHTEEAPWLRSMLDSRNFVSILFMIFVICLGLSYLYYRYAKKQLAAGMQQRVQHEVQQQLQLYHRMEEAPGKPAAVAFYSTDAAFYQHTLRISTDEVNLLQQQQRRGGGAALSPGARTRANGS
ncbi:vacuolar sorting receptor protein, putative [Eimeria mitis]|uniref:Vacuolar sorting receptor protein, putative n=1 Tax=Eimeria mitis TaxID=44415 RepID=U6KI57_9EIME|nr:vacuolar sorting receptor protein, putative [Eimeria mitis]CDJ36471.1 vacuolar sorting receptor protein, putative [Eimeria mitis]